jgi:hypothetical protein
MGDCRKVHNEVLHGLYFHQVQGGAKRTHIFEMGYLPAISFFGVTSNQKSTFKTLVQSTI